MRIKTISAVIMTLVFMYSFSTAEVSQGNPKQDVEEKNLSLKYRAFLKENQLIMMKQEKELFLGLENDEDRDYFIQKFRQSRNNRGIRENINLLMMLRLTQILDLTESQAAEFFPKMNRLEKEKRRLNQELGLKLRALRLLLKEERYEKEKLSRDISQIKELRERIRAGDAELEKFAEQNLSLEQQAKFLLFFQDFYRQLREQLNRARSLQQKKICETEALFTPVIL